MTKAKKGNKVYTTFAFKCPKCAKGDLYPTGTFSFSKPFDMNDNCDHCEQKFFPEPGFYYGAMFISYIFTGWFSIGFVLLLHWIFKWNTTASFAALIAILAFSGCINQQKNYCGSDTIASMMPASIIWRVRF